MIKNKLKLGSSVALTLAIGFFGTGTAFAGDVVFSADTPVSMSGTSNITFTVLSGSQANSYIVNPTTITVTVVSPDTFTLYSANRYTVTNDAGIFPTCDASFSQTVVTTGTVVLTPSANPCPVVSVSASSGGGGGGGVVDTTPPYNTSISINAGVTSTNTTSVTLTLAATEAYQMLMSNASDFSGATWETYATSKVWTLLAGEGVKTVYAKFRDSAGNISSFVSDTITFSASAVVTPIVPVVPVTPVVPTTPAVPAVPATPVAPVVLKALPYPAAKTAAEMQANLTVLMENLAALQAQKSATPATPATPTTPTNSAVPESAIPASGSYTEGLAVGSQNADVTALQNFLKSQGADIYPEGSVTGYYGNLTKIAVGKFQIKRGIVKSASDPGYGNVGPKTRDEINTIIAAPTTTPATPAIPATPAVTTVPTTPTPATTTPVSGGLNNPLTIGSTGNDVSVLQQLLKDEGVYPGGLVTGYYGSLTTQAVQKFQEKYGIAAPGVTGYGNVGPKTRAKINSLLGL